VAFLLVYAERKARKDRAFHENSGSTSADTLFRIEPSNAGKLALTLACLVPTLIGFGIPLYILGGFTYRYFYTLLDPNLMDALMTTAALASIGALITVTCAILLAYTVRIAKSPLPHLIVRFSCLGYAIPGTIVALGIFLPLAALDNFMNTAVSQRLGFNWGLLLTGTGITLIYAYTVRFMAMAEGVVEGGMKKLSPNLDMAARSLGRSPVRILREVHIILLRPVVAVGFLLVFIEITKELSATILLRPFGLNTLSTYVYELASRALVEEAGLASLIIVLLGTIPVILVSKLTMKDI
ncbi:MAG: ABC transporter permease, partial [Methyloligellaceae bacterium]